MVTKVPKIQIDHREKSSGIVELIEKNDVAIEVKQLKYGDYIINNNTVIERKSAKDFIASIIDGRLFRQCRLMRKHADNPLFLIEGDLYGTKYQMERKAIQGAIVSICSSWKIPILFTYSLQETVETIMLIAQQKNEEKVALRMGYKPKTVTKQGLYILQGLPGIGAKNARNLFEHFGSVERVMSADIADLSQVEGIGKITAKKIRNIVTKAD